MYNRQLVLVQKSFMWYKFGPSTRANAHNVTGLKILLSQITCCALAGSTSVAVDSALLTAADLSFTKALLSVSSLLLSNAVLVSIPVSAHVYLVLLTGLMQIRYWKWNDYIYDIKKLEKILSPVYFLLRQCGSLKSTLECDILYRYYLYNYI